MQDGPRAVILAEKAVAATARTNANSLDTLATAYAAAGKFEEAVSAEREALALLNYSRLKPVFLARLKLYESNTCYCAGMAF